MNAADKSSRFLTPDTTIRGLELLAAAAVIGFVFWNLQTRTTAICCGDFDGYYHIKWSRMLW